MAPDITVEPLGASDSDADRARLDEIFFTSSLRTSFPSPEARLAFHDRWLGRYLRHERAHGFVARSAHDGIVGYIVGALADPAGNSRYADLDLYPAIADLTRIYPAHLHINVLEAYRSAGVGGLLIAAFVEHAARNGAPGVHLVTGAASRNVAFYERNGFARLRTFTWGGARNLMLGRKTDRAAVATRAACSSGT